MGLTFRTQLLSQAALYAGKELDIRVDDLILEYGDKLKKQMATNFVKLGQGFTPSNWRNHLSGYIGVYRSDYSFGVGLSVGAHRFTIGFPPKFDQTNKGEWITAMGIIYGFGSAGRTGAAIMANPNRRRVWHDEISGSRKGAEGSHLVREDATYDGPLRKLPSSWNRRGNNAIQNTIVFAKRGLTKELSNKVSEALESSFRHFTS